MLKSPRIRRHPDSEYGWEKLFSERLYFSPMPVITVSRFRSHGSTISSDLRALGGVAGKRLPRQSAERLLRPRIGGEIEIWGDGVQTRSFLYIDECVEGVRRLMESSFQGPVNIGSEEMVTINQLAEMTMRIAGKQLRIRHIPGPLGVRGRNSDNRLIAKELNWEPSAPLEQGLRSTYEWINSQVQTGVASTGGGPH